jgi:tungstate transport system ATP-binding protein
VDPTHDAILEARGLVVTRSGRELVRVPHIALRPGEVHVLLGPNGAGKTTLLRALDGLEAAEGELRFRGGPVTSGGDRLRLRRQTAAVFQRSYLLATTVRGNVESGLRLRGVKGPELRRRTDEALALLGITQLAERRRAGLSGGEAQRVSIARALAVDPAVLFLDEPMASLDPPTRRSLAADLESIFRRLSTAVLWVTHDTDEARLIADQITFLADGKVVQQGPTAQVFDQPASTVVADYLGVDVWLEGRVELRGDGAMLVLTGDAELRCQAQVEGHAVACIHPEDVVVTAGDHGGPPGPESSVLSVDVTDVREVGRSVLVGLDWHGHRISAALPRAAFASSQLRPGGRAVARIAAVAVEALPRQEVPDAAPDPQATDQPRTKESRR